MAPPHIEARSLTLAYGDFVVQRDVSFTVRRGEVFVLMGDSGCGKSTLMRHMIGLNRPASGEVYYHGEPFWSGSPGERAAVKHRFGVLFQGGALWSSMTLLENASLPLLEHAGLPAAQAREVAALKLAMVGLAGFEGHFPSEISGGMRKRAGLARAMALDPEILFFDEPSAGLDPLAARRLDDLILELKASLGTTIVLVTHELPSLLELGDASVFLDAERKTMIATGPPRELREACPNPKVRAFLRRERA